MSDQVAGFELHIKGSTETVRSLKLVEELLAANAKQLKEIKIQGQLAAKQTAEMTKENAKQETQLKKVQAQLKANSDRMKELLATNKQASNEYKNLKKETQELTQKEKELNQEVKVNRQVIEASKKQTQEASKAEEVLTIKKAALRQETSVLNKQLRDQAKAYSQLNDKIPKDSLVGMERTLSMQIKQWRELNEAQRNSPMGKQLLKDIDQTKAKVDQLNERVGNFRHNVGNYQSALNNLGKGLVQFGLQSLGMTSALAVGEKVLSHIKETIVEYDNALANLATNTVLTKEQTEELGRAAIEASGRFGTSANELLDIYSQLVSARPNLAENLELLKATADQVDILSKAEKINSEVASGAVTDAAKKFNIELSRSAEIIDTYASSADRGKADVTELAAAVKIGGSTAQAAGVDFKGFLDIVSAMSKTGVRGEESATKLNRVLAVLAQTGRDDLNPALRSIPDILDTLDKEFGVTAGSSDALRKASDLFSARSGSYVLAMINQRDAIRDLNGQQIEYNAALTDAIRNTDTIQGRTDELKETWDKIILSQTTQGTTFTSFIKEEIQGLTSLLNILNDTKISDFLVKGIFAFKTANQKDNEAFKKEIDDILNNLGGVEDKADGVTKALNDFLKILGLTGKQTGDSVEDASAKVEAMKDKLKELKDELVVVSEEGDQDEIQRITKEIDALEKKLNPTKTALNTFMKGSLGALNKHIADLNNDLQKATSDAVRESITKTIAGLELQKEIIEGKLQEVKDAIDKARSESIKSQISAPIPNTGVEEFAPPTDGTLSPEAQRQLDEDNKAKQLASDLFFQQTQAGQALFHAEEMQRINKEKNDRIAADNLENDAILLEQQRLYADAEYQKQLEINAAITSLFNDMSNNISDIFSKSEEDRKKGYKGLLLSLVKYVEAQIRIELTAAQARARIAALVGDPLTLPVRLAALAAQAALSQGLLTAAFAVLNGLVQSFETGLLAGKVKDASGKRVSGDHTPYRTSGSKDTVIARLHPGEEVINIPQQKRFQDMFGMSVRDAVMGTAPANNAAMNNRVIVENRNSVSAHADINGNSIDKLARATARAIHDSNRRMEREELVNKS